MNYLLKILLYGLVFFALFGCTSSQGIFTSPREERESTITEGEIIIAATKLYQEKYDTHPKLLSELIPEFISDVPLTFSGEEFEYDTEGGFTYEEWSLTFYVESDDTGCTYKSHIEFWDCWPPNAGDE